jgi:hypothetical protein
MTTLRIETVNGKWLVNGRSYKELSVIDREQLNNFFKGIKAEIEDFESQKNLDFERELRDYPVIFEIIEP